MDQELTGSLSRDGYRRSYHPTTRRSLCFKGGYHRLIWMFIFLLCCMPIMTKSDMCNLRNKNLPAAIFNRSACATCYKYLHHGAPLIPVGPNLILTEPQNYSQPSIIDIYSADVNNQTAVSQICDTLKSDDDCWRWTQCCHAAAACCQRQLNVSKMAAERQSSWCPRTWDGYSCWDDTPGGTKVTAQCPNFISTYVIPSRQSIKECTQNGTWWAKSAGNPWTDFRPCLDKTGYLQVMYVGLSCHVISVLLLVPALIIFLVIRQLRMQQRVKLHVNFFISLALANLAHILWYMLVHHDLLTSTSQSHTVLYKNPVWCRALSFFKLYLQSTNYFWMFCEGYFLHRLISKAFEPPKRLILLHLFGWVVPLLPAIAHAIAITIIDNASCWTRSIGGYQWLVYAPNLLCLLVNLIFLCNILRILLFQLHAHPHEPSNFRKGLKAAFMLIPLFGLQLFLTMYRPNPDSAYVKEWEFFSTVINSSQGIFVSIIFCYLNGEVLNHFRNKCPCCRKAQLRRSRLPSTSMTQYTTYDQDDVTRDSFRSRGAHGVTNENGSRSSVHAKDVMEMEELNGKSRNGPAVKTKGGYMAVPTSVSNANGGSI